MNGQRLIAARLREDEGAFAVLFAIVIVLIVGIAALVVDQSTLRFDRRTDKAATDAAALAGINGLIGSDVLTGTPQRACQGAFDYVWTDLSITSPPGNNCSSFPTKADVCTSATPPQVATATLTNAGITYTVSVLWPVPDKSPLMTPDLEKWQDPAVSQAMVTTDNSSCDRVGVTIAKNRPTAFGGIFGQSGATSTSASVASFKPGDGNLKAVVPLVILDPHRCNALDASGGASDGGIWVENGINSGGDPTPGLVGVNSDGTVNCNGGKTVINTSSGNGNSNVHIWAYDSKLGAPARIFSFALQTGGPAYQSGDTANCTKPQPQFDSGPPTVPFPPPGLGDHLCPQPEFSGLIPDPAADDQPYIAGLDAWAPATATEASNAGWNVVTNCNTLKTGLLTSVITTDTYVNCALTLGTKDTAAFPGTHAIVFGSDVTVKSGGALCFNATAVPCTPDATANAQPVIMRGALDAQPGSTLFAPQTFILQSDGSPPTPPPPSTYTSSNTSTQLAVKGTVDWTSLVDDGSGCNYGGAGAPPLNCLARLAYWSDYDSDAAGGNNVDYLSASSAVDLKGVWHIPFSEFDFAGSAKLRQMRAQFIVKRLSLVGGGNLVMVPDAQFGFESNLYGGGLIR